MAPEELRLSHSEATANANLWDIISRQSWTPPSALTDKQLSEIKNEHRIWLCRAVDLMAFADATRPINQVETDAKRQQAARALFEAARLQKVKLIGNPSLHGDASEPIPDTYFDIARALCHVDHGDNTIGPDLNCEMIDFVAARTGHRQTWSKVRIDVETFLNWLQQQLPDTASTKYVPAYKTGAPGRPTSMQLIRKEFDDRNERGDSATTITQEAKALAGWLKTTHPEAAPATPKTIGNQLSKPFRDRRVPAQK